MNPARIARCVLTAAALAASVRAGDGTGIVALYFPPTPPVLGAALSRNVPAPPMPAPAALAPYVAEPFYGPLAVQEAAGQIGPDLQYALQAYAGSEAALLAELRARLDTLREASPAAREAALRRFAVDQSPRIARAEADAEALRQNLCSHSAASRDYLRWRIDSSVVKGQVLASPQVWRQEALIAAYFLPGPTPAQRRLLREIALQFSDPEALGAWFFSPAGARLGPDQAATPALRSELDAYAKDRQALKAQIVALLGNARERRDERAWQALSEAQAARWEELERKADHIRGELIRINDPSPYPTLPRVPGQLAARIEAYRQEKLSLQKSLLARVDAAKRAGSAEGAAERIRQAIADFTQENAARYDALARAKDEIRADVAKAQAPAGGGAASEDSLLNGFNASLRHLETAWDYREYQTAVFQPGLSPEQRRLLFAGALAKLALPLPGGEHPAAMQ